MDKITFKWDKFSDQPNIIANKKLKKSVRKRYIYDYIKLFLTSLAVLPIAILTMGLFRGKKEVQSGDFYGMGVNSDKGDAQQDLIEELGVKNLLIRVPLSDIKNLDRYFEFAKSFTLNSPKNITLNILQDRENIENKELLEENLRKIFAKFNGFVDEYQIANAVNRFKWGFFSPKEYLEFYQIAYKLKMQDFPHIKLIGPSVIDFEYYFTARLLYNNFNLKYDITNTLLYVDRRGSAKNSQMGIFDLKNKINLLFCMCKLSPKASNDIYITEANWPLSNTTPYAPTSEKECVSNEVYTSYMLEYHHIAKKSGKIKKLFWHQLIAPGYGLIDNRDGEIKKLPQFYAYKKMVQENG